MTDGVHVRLMVTRGVKSHALPGPADDRRARDRRDHRRAQGADARDGRPTASRCSPRTCAARPRTRSTRSSTRTASSTTSTACIQAYTAGADEALMLDPHGFVATCNSTHFFVVVERRTTGPRCGRPTAGSASAASPAATCSRCAARTASPRARRRSASPTSTRAPEAFVTGTFAGRRAGARRSTAARSAPGARGPVVERLQEPVRRPGRRRRTRPAPCRDRDVRVAMWSGPRNISTAMMRAWENRPDTVVVDEPFYAAYLARDRPRPSRPRRGARGPADRRRRGRRRSAARRCRDGAPGPLRQAHDPPPRSTRTTWPGLGGVPQRAADPRPRRGGRLLRPLARGLRARGHRPAPAGAAARRAGTRRRRRPGHRRRRLPAATRSRYLRWLCDWLGIDFTDRMLSWPAGPRDIRRRVGAALVRRRAGPRPASSRTARATSTWTPRARRSPQACRPAYERLHAARLIL